MLAGQRRPGRAQCLSTSVCLELVDPWDVQNRRFDGGETSNVRKTALKSVKKCTKLIVNYYFTLPAFGRRSFQHNPSTISPVGAFTMLQLFHRHYSSLSKILYVRHQLGRFSIIEPSEDRQHNRMHGVWT